MCLQICCKQISAKRVNNGQKTIEIRPHTRYNIGNLIRKQCYHYRILSENGSHKYEFVGTEWLNLRVTMSLICQREVLNLDDFQFSYFDMDLQEG